LLGPIRRLSLVIRQRSPTASDEVTVYFTCFANQGSAGSTCRAGTGSVDMQTVQYQHNGTTVGIGNLQPGRVCAEGAEGIQFAPHRDLLVAGRQSDTVSQVTSPCTRSPNPPHASTLLTTPCRSYRPLVDQSRVEATHPPTAVATPPSARPGPGSGGPGSEFHESSELTFP